MSYSTEVLNDSPVAYWRLDESSGTTANDSTASNHDGTYNGSPTLGEPSLISDGTSVDFDGSDDYISIPSSSDFNFEDNIGALEGWGKVPSGAIPLVPFFRGDSDDNWHVRITSSQVQLRFEKTSNDTWSTNHNLNSGDTIHFVINNFGSGGNPEIEVWINGVEENTFNINYPLIDAGDLWISRSHNFYGEGTLDELAIYPSTLSETRIDAHYVAGTLQEETISAFDIALSLNSLSNFQSLGINNFDVTQNVVNLDPLSLETLGKVSKSFDINSLTSVFNGSLSAVNLINSISDVENSQSTEINDTSYSFDFNVLSNEQSESIGNLSITQLVDEVLNVQSTQLDLITLSKTINSLDSTVFVLLGSINTNTFVESLNNIQTSLIKSLDINTLPLIISNERDALLDAISLSLTGAILEGNRSAFLSAITLGVNSESLTYDLALREVTIPSIIIPLNINGIDTNRVIGISAVELSKEINDLNNKQLQDIGLLSSSISISELDTIQSQLLNLASISFNQFGFDNSRGILFDKLILEHTLSDIENNQINNILPVGIELFSDELVNSLIVHLNKVLVNFNIADIVDKRYADILSVDLTIEIIDHFIRSFAYDDDRTSYVLKNNRIEVVKNLERKDTVGTEDRITIVDMKDRESYGNI